MPWCFWIPRARRANWRPIRTMADTHALAEWDFPPSGMIGGWAPGATPPPATAGMAHAIAKGTDVVLQIHYHPSGKPEEDQSALGLHFSGPPTKGRAGVVMSYRRIDIPAGDSHYVVKSEVTLPRDVDLFGITPHAHYLGKDMRVNAYLPDGTTKPLIWIKDWDFNWQGSIAISSRYPCRKNPHRSSNTCTTIRTTILTTPPIRQST